MTSAIQIPPKMQLWGLALFVCMSIVIGGMSAYTGARGVYYGKQSVTWPIAEGRIEKSDTKHQAGSDMQDSSVDILYHFTVDGRTYQGSRVIFGDAEIHTSCRAMAIANQYPKNAAVSVYYLPTDPGTCALKPGIARQAWMNLGMGSLFVFIGTLAAIFVPRALRRSVNNVSWSSKG